MQDLEGEVSTLKVSSNFCIRCDQNSIGYPPLIGRAVVVAQMVERLLSKPEICGSNPDICNILSINCTIDENKK